MTKEQFLGKKEILEGIRTKKWLLYGTDKLEKLVLDTFDNFLKAVAPHIQDHIKVSIEDVEKAEKTLNNHSKLWCKVTQIGNNVSDSMNKRIQQATHVEKMGVPQLKGVRKDHKDSDPEYDPPVRVMMDGKKGPNGPAANLVAQLLRPVKNSINDKVGTEVISTEEVCHHFEKFNNEVLNRTGPRRQPRRANKAPPPSKWDVYCWFNGCEGFIPKL